MLVQCEVRQVPCPVSGRRDPEAALAGHPMVGGWISGGLSVAGGLATAALGAAVLAGRFSAIRARLLS